MKLSGSILVILSLLLAGFGSAQPAKESITERASAKRVAGTSSRSGKATAAKSPGRRTTAKKTVTRKKKKSRAVIARHVRRLRRAFVASSDLKPMARQLLGDRTKAAYAGVEAYARKHARDDAGALAWLVLGYAHTLDRDYPAAIVALKRAQAHAGDLGDYVAYFLGLAYSATGNAAAAVATLRDFEAKYPDSLFLRDAIHTYGNALVASDRPAEAARVMEKYRLPARSGYELAIGRAYEQSGQYRLAAEAYKRVYCAFPTSVEATDALTALNRITGQEEVTPATFSERKSRADLLAQARRNADAAREYRVLLSEAPESDRTVLQIALGIALHRSGNDREARSLLESVPETPGENNAKRLLALAEIARSDDDAGRFAEIIGRMRQTAATSESFEEALLAGGNLHLLKKDYDKAIDYYRELQQRFPAGRRASYAHWKAAWLSLRQGRREEARKGFEEQVAKFPRSPEVSAALYWRARLAEEDGDLPRARAWYAKLVDRFQNYYYADLGRARLKALAAPVTAFSDPLLDRITASKLPEVANTPPPADDIRVQKAMLLHNGGLTEFAVNELRAAAADGASWASIEVARLYLDGGRYDRALQTLKRAVPSYYELPITALPRPYWEALFPRAYWPELKRYAAANDLDPYLVASLIRQESEFDPAAVSRAEALGLMQLLPATGQKVARELKVRRYSHPQLLTPNFNLQLGTRYFRNMVDQFGGRVEFALAAYNAGPHRVEDWLAEGKYRDTEEFVESIPFTETREYVQAIMRNTSVYKRLYATP
ncbi:MAG: transglycosylase SLT domain-containing protein [Terriglobales bacterium]